MDKIFRGAALEVNIEPDISSAGRVAAALAAEIIRETPRAVLGLTADHSLLPFYEELARMCREEDLDFSQVTVFNLDSDTGTAASRIRFMRENFFERININPSNVHIPDASGTGYEQKIIKSGGLDIQILDLDAARQLQCGGSVPFLAPCKTGTTSETLSRSMAVNMETVMNARVCLMLAAGRGAAPAVAAAVEGALFSGPASWILKQHSCAHIFMDDGAAAELKLKEYYQWIRTGEPVRCEIQAA